LQDEGRLVVPPAFIAESNLGNAVTGAPRFSYGISLCENNADEGDFITWLVALHHPTTL
jgi:hypothetical protein